MNDITQPTVPAASPEPPIAPTTTPTAQVPQSWIDKLSPDDQAWATNKGWKADTDPGAIATSYRNLEQMFGADKANRTMLMPKDANDVAALDAIYERLGRPKEATGYELNIEGADENFVGVAKQMFHKAGLTGDQAKTVAEAYRAAELDAVQKVQQEFAKQTEDLKRDWGDKYDHNIEIGKAAVQAAGLTKDEVELISGAIGPMRAAKVMEFFGRNYNEGQPPGRDTRTNSTLGHMTPAGAEAEIAKLYNDPAFMARFGHRDEAIRAGAMKEMEALNEVAIRAKMG